jgi:acyl transferase domain-containing protein/acyl carrier protein
VTMTTPAAADGAPELSPIKRAYLALERLQAKCRALEQARCEPIAVVGMACRLPGGADSPDAYWRLLRAGTDAVCDVPAGRWDIGAYYDPDPSAAGKMSTRLGGYLREPVDLFDPQFFGISPREAECIDPQHRLLLEVGWEALEHAAQIEDRLAGSPTGVFVGITSHDYSDWHFPSRDLRQVGTHMITGNSHNAAAGRLSYCFGFHGPALAVDTACSSSLVAIHLACRSLLQDECRRALAGGVNLILSPLASIALSQGRVLAPDGRCRAFDAAASGMVRGEGCAVVVLKRLSHAIEDRDNIFALIRSTAVNQDGPSSGLTVPNGPAQEALIRQALASAELKPDDIDYVEAHGTGTPLGDPIELGALAAVFGGGRDRPLVLGSVKTNIGHLEACAGIAGLIKVVLSLQHGEIPPHLHFDRPTPHLAWSELPFVVSTEPRPWPAGSRPRRAGASSFGFSGVNAHVVLQEAPEPISTGSADGAPEVQPERSLHLLALSGRSKAALRDIAQRFARHLERDSPALGDVCFSAAVGRVHASHRLAVVATSPRDAHARLTAFLDAGSLSGVYHGSASAPPKVAFLFTGQGSQYPGMGRDLYDTQPVYREALQRCDAILRPVLRRSLLDMLFGAGEGSELDQTGHAQPALFAVEYALAALWQSWGVRPAVVLGHSVGEYVAACIAGVFGLEDGLRLIAERARLMQALPREGAMVAMSAAASEVERIVRPYGSKVCIAAYNSPGNVVVSGETSAVAAIVRDCLAAGIPTQPLRVSHALHSHLMDPILGAFEDKVREISLAAPRIAFISNVDGGPASAEVTRPEYWRRHLREPVRFAQGIAAAREKGCTAFLEIGPKPTLLGLARQCVDAEDAGWLPSLRPGAPDSEQMLQSLAELYVRGARVDWPGFDRPYPRRRVALPTTPFQRQRYWLESPGRADKSPLDVRQSDVHPLLGRRLSLAGTTNICFQSQIRRDDPAFLQDHVVFQEAVLPASAYLEMAAAAACAVFGSDGAVLENVAFQHALRLPDQEAKTLQTLLKPETADSCSFEIYSRDESAPGDAWVCHAAGVCRSGAGLPRAVEDATWLAADAGEAIDAEAIYQRARAFGVELGPRFKALRRAWRRDARAWAEIVLPETLVFGAGDYLLHPVMLDGAFQTMGAVFADRSDGGVYLPVALDRVEIHRTGTEAWSRVRVEPMRDGECQALRVDLQVVSAAGRVAAALEGLQLKLTSREQLQRASSPSFAGWLYEVQWIPSELKAAQRAADSLIGSGNGQIEERDHRSNRRSSTLARIDAQTEIRVAAASRRDCDHWLVLAPANSSLANALRERIEQSGDWATLVYPGEAYRWAGQGTAWIVAADAAHFRTLIEEIRAVGRGRLAKVVHLWGTGTEAEAEFAAGRPDKADTLGWGAALHLVQAVTKFGDARPPCLWLVTRSAQRVADEREVTGIAQAPLFGLGKVVNLEYPQMRCVCVDLDHGNEERAAERLFEEIRVGSTEDQVALRGERRYVARLARHSDAGKPSALLIRPDATYLITGGQQGLGLQTAHWLVERGARSLVLLSRRDRSGEIASDLAELQRPGAVVQAIRCDVSDTDRLARVLGDIQADRPALRGVIHSAGVLDDATLAQQTTERFRRVMAPKMLGAWNLHRLTRDVPLDFFVMYSSMASLLASAGQANYVAANAFLDALAHHRRASGLPALSINWGSWSEVGMSARHQLERSMKAQGLGMIAPRQGLHIQEHLLSRQAVQVGVSPIDWSVLAQRSHTSRRSPFFANIRELRNIGAAQDHHPLIQKLALGALHPSERQARVAACLGAEIAAVLRLAPEDVEVHQPLNRIGLDSLMAVELRNRLRSQLGLDIPLVTFMQETSMTDLAVELSARLAEAAAVGRKDNGGHPTKPETDARRPIAPIDAGPLLDRLDQLTEEEVDALLGAALSGEFPGELNTSMPSASATRGGRDAR